MARPVFQRNKTPSTRPIRFLPKFNSELLILQQVFKEIPKIKRSKGSSIKDVRKFLGQFDLPLVRRCPLLVELALLLLSMRTDVIYCSLVTKIFVTSGCTSKVQKCFNIQTYDFKEINVSDVTIIKFEFGIIGFIEAIEKLKFRLPSLKCPSDTKLIFLSFFSEQCSNALKDSFSQFTSHIHL